MDDYPTRADEVREAWKLKEKLVSPVERLRALEQTWRADAKEWNDRAAREAEDREAYSDSCMADTYEACADELKALIAELGQEAGAVDFPPELKDRVDRLQEKAAKNATSPAHTSEARDATRLDFMVHRGAVIDCSYNNDKRTVYRAMAFGQPLTGWHSSYREAIDAAMRQEGGE